MNQSALPSEVGPYRVVARLGHGGMGEVFLGDLDGLRVAIKRVHPALAADAEFRERFSREVELCQRVDSSTCARFVDADLTASIPWLATEYIAGPNLKEAVAAGGALDAPQAEVVALGLAEALRQIHAVGIVHRDLKPSNVILGVDGPRVIDFGIARAFDQTVFTRTGGALGSPGWMAPEQLRQGTLSEASDIFAWGALVAYASSGRPPFGESLPETLMHRVLNDEPDLESVPLSLRGLCERALDKDFAARPSAEELVAELIVTGGMAANDDMVTRRIDLTWRLPENLVSRYPVPTVKLAGFPAAPALDDGSSAGGSPGVGTAVGAADLALPSGRRRKAIAACAAASLLLLVAAALVVSHTGSTTAQVDAPPTTQADPMTFATDSWPAFAATLPAGRATEIVAVEGTPTVGYAFGDDSYASRYNEVGLYEFTTEWKKAGYRYLGKYDPAATMQRGCNDLCVNPQGDLEVFGHVTLRFVDITGDGSLELIVEAMPNHINTSVLRRTGGSWTPVMFGNDTGISGGPEFLDSTHLRSSVGKLNPATSKYGTETTNWVWNSDTEKFDVVDVVDAP